MSITTVTAEERQGRATASRRANIDRSGGITSGHPTTSEIEYSLADMEFMSAVQEYKRRTGRQFPTLREILAVVRTLGYVKPYDGTVPRPHTL